MAASKSKSSNRTTIVVAIIGAIGVIVAAILGSPIILKFLNGSAPSSEQITVRTADNSGASIAGAKVLLFFQGGPLNQITDSNGTASFTLAIPEKLDIRLIVEKDQYEILEQGIQLPRDKNVDIRLKKRIGSEAGVIFRVVDNIKQVPIAGAKILLLVQGDVFSQATDLNGITKFMVSFPSEGKIDAEMSVETKDYQINNQSITLTPNKVQDVRLNPDTSKLEIGDVTQLRPSQQTPEAQQGEANSQTSVISPTIIAVGKSSKGGVTIQTLVSNLVDTSTGFRVTVELSTTEKDNGELAVTIRTPDNQPFVGKYVAVHKQKSDLNDQPLKGDRVAELRTDDTGSATIKLPPGIYGIYPDIAGSPWKEINFNQKVEASKKTTIVIIPSRFVIVIRRADNSLITNSYINISTQKADLNGKPLVDQRVLEARTRDTGEATFDLTPSNYSIYFDAARGEDWGSFDNKLLPATQLMYNMVLGRIRIEARNDKGDIAPGFYSRVVFQKKDVNNRVIPGDTVSECRTDNTGACNHDITPGTYIVQSDAGDKFEVEVKSGETIMLKNSDFTKPQSN